MELTILLGILSSVATEVVTAINAKLEGTVLKGDGAFILSFGIALPAAIVKEFMMPGFDFHMLLNYQQLAANFSEIFAISQVYFLFVAQKLGLDLPSGTTKTTTTAVVTTTASAPMGDPSGGTTHGGV